MPAGGLLTASLISAGLGIGVGLLQEQRAKKLEAKSRPVQTPPPSATHALNLARTMAGENQLPGQDIIEGKLGASTAGAVSELKASADSPSAILANISKVYANQMDKERDLAIAGAGMKRTNEGNYINALNNYGQLEQKAWDWNTGMPYTQDMAAASALHGSAVQNISGGINTGINTFSQSLMNKMYLDAMKEKPTLPSLEGTSFAPAPDDPNKVYDSPDGSSQAPNILDKSFIMDLYPEYGKPINTPAPPTTQPVTSGQGQSVDIFTKSLFPDYNSMFRK